MKILFLGDVVGLSGRKKITNDLSSQIKKNNIDFVIVNGENADVTGVGLTQAICEDFFKCGVNVVTTGNHVWDQKDIMKFIKEMITGNQLIIHKTQHMIGKIPALILSTLLFLIKKMTL